MDLRILRLLVVGCGLTLAAGASALASTRSGLPVSAGDTATRRPDHVNNALTPFFPPVFNQDGGSCGSASRISYMFAYELNAFRGDDASRPEHIYPSHFTWLLTNSHSGKEGMARANGVPNSVVYGGSTYSKLFGNQDCSAPDFGWMQGYDKWYAAMFNRISHNSFSPYGVDTEEGRELVKNWLWNHQGDGNFFAGGICGIGVASACKQGSIGDDPEGRNARAGVVGMKYVTRWGDGVDHALTIVGYDDRIVFDLDSNKVYGEPDKDERGAWIIVNSWGNGWANRGFIYCPYKYGFPVRQHEGGAWKPEFYHVRKNYRPLRTLKVLMDYSRRSELKLSVGIAADPAATEPDRVVEMEHFKFAGDGRSDKAKAGQEAETPMLGRWADGELHAEPMEFGYDLTDLSADFDVRRPLRYFLIIESRPEAVGTGTLRALSVIDYEFDHQGIETPFELNGGVQVRNQGGRTVVSTVVNGEPFFAPLNLHCADGRTLQWSAPPLTWRTLEGYVVYKDGQPADTLATTERAFTVPDPSARYTVRAAYAYADSLLQSPPTESVRPDFARMGKAPDYSLVLDSCGFSVPGAFRSHYDHATIEYWLNPRTLRDWNQSVGPGWGRFLIHANNDGAVTAGWDTDNRLNTRPGTLAPGRWTHLAFVVASDTLTVYVDGVPADTLVAKGRSGFGGFGRMPFSSSADGALNGRLAEVRLWKCARTADEIRTMMHHRFEAAGLPDDLLAYYRGDTLREGRRTYLCDLTGRHHARLARFGHYGATTDTPVFTPATEARVDFRLPAGKLYAGQPFTLRAECSPAITAIRWQAQGGGIDGLSLRQPSLLFAEPGDYDVQLVGATADGKVVRHGTTLHVLPRELSAAFSPIRSEGAAGERISFRPDHPLQGYQYEWELPGADCEQATTLGAAATYERPGDYRVRLRVTDPQTGHSTRSSLRLHVRNVAPAAAFDLSPMALIKGASVRLTDRSRYLPETWRWTLATTSDTVRAEGRHPEIAMQRPGVYDVTLEASNAEGTGTFTQRRALIVCNADSKNGLNFSNAEAAVTTDRSPWTGGTGALTVEWWMNAATGKATAGIGDAAATWLIQANENGRLTFWADSLSMSTGNDFIQPGSWHHYAVRFDRGEVSFLRDGICLAQDSLRRKERRTRTVPAATAVRLGGTKHPMNAIVDEVRIWRRALPTEALRRYANTPIADIAAAERTDSLCLYYTFNQSGGDVADATSNGLSGHRSGFGPDGDAWGVSTGVFSLDFPEGLTDVSADYLPHNARPFPTTGQSVNSRDPKRFLELKPDTTGRSWRIENCVDADTIRTGFYVDVNKRRALCVYTGWDHFAQELKNHKLYTTVELPAGRYEWEVESRGMTVTGRAALVVARGSSLPDLGTTTGVIATAPLEGRRTVFELTQPTTVSLGIVLDLKGRSGVLIDRLVLRRAELTEPEK